VTAVDFFYGPGSRYSYLASTQLPAIEARTGATFRWRALFSGELIARAGGANPFSDARGQYQAAYRSRDAARWAAHYGAPYREPAFDKVDWPLVSLWCAGAELLDANLGIWALTASFARGETLNAERLRAGADELGFGNALTALIANGEATRRHKQNIQDALKAGAFGAPTFVCSGGEIFWGQDRIPLLIDHLRATDHTAPRSE
jgi:2-hydroxychromene-2-carboxylate isomerase